MNFKLIAIFLSFFITVAIKAKPAPQNTFRMDYKDISGSNSNKNDKREKIRKIQDKITALKADNPENFFLLKFQEFRVERLENELEPELKK